MTYAARALTPVRSTLWTGATQGTARGKGTDRRTEGVTLTSTTGEITDPRTGPQIGHALVAALLADGHPDIPSMSTAQSTDAARWLLGHATSLARAVHDPAATLSRLAADTAATFPVGQLLAFEPMKVASWLVLADLQGRDVASDPDRNRPLPQRAEPLVVALAVLVAHLSREYDGDGAATWWQSQRPSGERTWPGDAARN